MVEFEVDGHPCRLDAFDGGPEALAVPFTDATSGIETYGGGRYLVTGPVRADDTVEVDFNLAYNPPCVFTPYATCQLPPPANRLPVRIEAGEKDFHTATSSHPADRHR